MPVQAAGELFVDPLLPALLEGVRRFLERDLRGPAELPDDFVELFVEERLRVGVVRRGERSEPDAGSRFECIGPRVRRGLGPEQGGALLVAEADGRLDPGAIHGDLPS